MLVLFIVLTYVFIKVCSKKQALENAAAADTANEQPKPDTSAQKPKTESAPDKE